MARITGAQAFHLLDVWLPCSPPFLSTVLAGIRYAFKRSLGPPLPPVGLVGFEPTTSAPQTRSSTKLSYSPKQDGIAHPPERLETVPCYTVTFSLMRTVFSSLNRVR